MVKDHELIESPIGRNYNRLLPGESLLLYHILIIQIAFVIVWVSLNFLNLLVDLFVDLIHHRLLSLFFAVEKFRHGNQDIVDTPFENHLVLFDLFIQKITGVVENKL